MYLKKPLWREAIEKKPTTVSTATDSPESESAPSNTAVGDLVNTLTRQRLYREITLALRTGLRDVRAEFSFRRIRGLRGILKLLHSVAESDSTIELFCYSQSVPELQVVPILFKHSLKEWHRNRVANLDHIFSVDPIKITSPSTGAEIALALRLLEGCCLLHRESTFLAHQHKAIQTLMNVLANRGVLFNLHNEFEACNGIEEVAYLIRDKQVDENLRLKCGEFLLLLIGHVNGRGERAPMATIHEKIRQLLGEKSASLIWAASQFGSTIDPEQRLTALHIQARRVMESLDLD